LAEAPKGKALESGQRKELSRKHEREASGWTNELLKDEHRTSNIEC